MPTNVSVKNVPDRIIDGLRKRAARHHRSLQGELMAIIEEAVAAFAVSEETGVYFSAPEREAASSALRVRENIGVHYLERTEEDAQLERRREAARIIDNLRAKYGPWDGASEVMKWRYRH